MTPESITEFSLRAAKQYLQSAVFIDDNIYNQPTASPGAEEIEVRLPKKVMRGKEEVAPSLVKQDAGLEKSQASVQSTQRFQTKDLVSSFAEHGIVCALYEPEEDFSTDETSTIFKLCLTADLVILDWDFHKDGVHGTKPKALIQNLISRGNRIAPHHVRLIAIYTNTPSLFSISNSLHQHFENVGIDTTFIDDCPFKVQAGASRVIVFGKAGSVARVEDEKTFTVSEKSLADRLLEEFALMNQGILPSCALLGMAAVRHSSARILDKFHSDLDAQFLLHRALIRNSEEAFDQLPELLGDEFKAIIEDTDYRPNDVTDLVGKASSGISFAPQFSNWKLDGCKGEEILREFLRSPNSLDDIINGKRKKPDGIPNNLLNSLAAMCSRTDKDSHCKFAALLAVRTQYQIKHRELSFGCIMLNRTSGKYSICLMPPCDAIRLTGDTHFPFWELGKEGKGHPIIIQHQKDKWLQLTFVVGKPSKYMRLVPFAPDPIRRNVITTMNTEGKYIFRSQETEFEWVAQLKPSHAQRLANIIGQQLSRVGLTEAEWARIAFSKSPENG